MARGLSEGFRGVLEAFDALAGDRPASSPRLPVFTCRGAGADALLAAYAQRLRAAHGRVLPHVFVDAGDPGAPVPAPIAADLSVFDRVARELGKLPSGAGRLRLPTYWAVRRTYDLDVAADRPETRKEVRDHLYGHLRRQLPWRPALDDIAESDRQSTVASGVVALARPVVDGVGRVLFGAYLARGRRFRQLKGAMWADGGAGHKDFLDVAVDLAESPNTAEGPTPELVRRALMLGLLLDLDHAVRPSLWSPRRRRRTGRFVIMLAGVRAGDAAHHLLDALGVASERRRSDPTLVLAALIGAPPAPRSLGAARPALPEGADEGPVDEAATRAELEALVAAPGRRPVGPPGAVRVDVPAWPVDETVGDHTTYRPHVVPRPPRRPVLVPALAWATVAVLVAGLAVLIVRLLGDDGCAGIERPDGATERVGLSDGTHACSFVAAEPATELDRGIQAIERQIADQNAAVLDSSPGPRTIVFFAPLTVSGEPESAGQSTLRELRGVALAQRQANANAEDDENQVPVRVRLANAGDRFRHGAEVADRIAEAARDDESIVGVVGIAQSRAASAAAIATLGDAGLPVVAGTVTGDDMVYSSRAYYQVAPNNDRTAEAMVAFTAGQPIVGPDDGLAVARNAVIVTDHSDAYSDNLAQNLHRHFTEAGGEVPAVYSYPAEDESAPPSPGWDTRPEVVDNLRSLASRVCGAIDVRRDVVFYTGRSQQFVGLLNALEVDPACGDERLTIVGGDALTRLVEDPQVSLGGYGFLRLYYAAFGSREAPERSDSRDNFVDLYEEAYRDDMGDIAFDISDPALNFDAMTLMHAAINDAFVEDELPTRGDVVDALASGIEFDGATGYITVHGNSASGRVPRNKPVLMVEALVDEARATPGTGGEGAAEEARRVTEPLLVCGRVSGAVDLDRWGPGLRHPCPTDPEDPDAP